MTEFNTKDLQNAVATLKAVAAQKSTYSAVTGLLYRDGYMFATDLVVSAKIMVQTSLGSGSDSFIIPRTAFDVIAKFSADSVSIDKQGSSISIKSGRYKGEFASIEPDEYPSIAMGEGDVLSRDTDIDLAKFKKSIHSVLYAVSKDEKKGALAGVNIMQKDDEITISGLDGFRLARNYGQLFHEPFNITVPVQFVSALSKMNSVSGRARLLIHDNKSIEIEGEDGEFAVSARVINSAFPDIDNVMSRVSPDKRVIVPRRDIVDALEIDAASQKDRGKNNLVVFDIDGGEGIIKISSMSADARSELEVPAELDGFADNFKIGFNASYLIEALKNMDAEDVLMQIQSPLTGVIIRDCDLPESMVAFVLPVRINAAE